MFDISYKMSLSVSNRKLNQNNNFISNQQRSDTKDSQYHQALKYIHCFSSRQRNMNLVPERNIRLILEIQKKMKDYYEQDKAHKYIMEVKDQELQKVRKRIECLEERFAQKQIQIKEKIMQINSTILQIPIKNYKPQWVEQELKLDDMVEATIKNANKVVQEFFRISEQQHIQIEMSPEFMLEGIDESAIQIGSDISLIDFNNQEQVEILEDKVKKLTTEKNNMTLKLQKAKNIIGEQLENIQELKNKQTQLEQYNQLLVNTVSQQLVKIEEMEQELASNKSRKMEQKEPLPPPLNFLKTNNSSNDREEQEDESFREERKDRELLQKFLSQENASLEKKVLELQKQKKELKEQHQKKMKSVEQSASNLMEFTDSERNQYISENKVLTTKLEKLERYSSDQEIQLITMKKKYNQKKEQVDQLKRQISQLKNDHQEELNRSVSKIVEQKNDENLKLIQELFKEDIQVLHKRVQVLEKQIKDLKKQHQLENEKHVLEKKQIQESTAKIFEYTNKIEDNWTKRQAELKAQIENVQDALATQRKKSKKLEIQLKSTESTLKEIIESYNH